MPKNICDQHKWEGGALALNAMDTGVSVRVRALLSDADPAGTIFKQKAHFEKSKKQFDSNRRGIGTFTVRQAEILDTTWRAKQSVES